MGSSHSSFHSVFHYTVRPMVPFHSAFRVLRLTSCPTSLVQINAEWTTMDLVLPVPGNNTSLYSCIHTHNPHVHTRTDTAHVALRTTDCPATSTTSYIDPSAHHQGSSSATRRSPPDPLSMGTPPHLNGPSVRTNRVRKDVNAHLLEP